VSDVHEHLIEELSWVVPPGQGSRLSGWLLDDPPCRANEHECEGNDG
jgi:hypothetical protein